MTGLATLQLVLQLYSCASKDQSCDRSYVVISKSYVIVPPVVYQKSYDHLQPFPKRSYLHIIIMLHYAVEAATQKNIYKHKYTKIQAQNHLLKHKSNTYREETNKNAQENTRRHAVYALLNCADEHFPYCLPLDVNRRQTMTSNGNKSL